MVDIAPEIAKNVRTDTSARKLGLQKCITDRAEALRYVERLPNDVFSTGYQCKAFLTAWLSQETAKPYFLIFSVAGCDPVLLPLEISANGTAIYCGGTHVNGNFPIGHARDIAALKEITSDDVKAAIKHLQDAPDVLFLERQHSAFEGIANPFVFEDSTTSPNVALSLSLEGGFSEVMARHNGKRKRKRMRNHTRKLESLGTLEIVQHVPCEEVVNTLQAFFRMKAERFKAAGICDVFAEEDVQNMFAQLFKQSCKMDAPNHVLKCVKLDGEPISVIGCTVHRGRITVEFGTFEEKYAAGGPGDLLFFHAIADACEKGLDIFDFGIGDEFYKRSWCEIETWHRDTAIAITAKGALKAKTKMMRNHAVRIIKSNRFIWTNLKKARKYFGWLQRC